MHLSLSVCVHVYMCATGWGGGCLCSILTHMSRTEEGSHWQQSILLPNCPFIQIHWGDFPYSPQLNRAIFKHESAFPIPIFSSCTKIWLTLFRFWSYSANTEKKTFHCTISFQHSFGPKRMKERSHKMFTGKANPPLICNITSIFPE